MQVDILAGLLSDGDEKQARSILNACVHCGFCTATCPTYLQTGNELDSPRGRIYLIKEMFETGSASDITQRHLDRCLTCQSCETTCPSGVEYHHLLAIGRATVEALSPRSLWARAQRRALRKILLSPNFLRVVWTLGRCLQMCLPDSIRRTYFVRLHPQKVADDRTEPQLDDAALYENIDRFGDGVDDSIVKQPRVILQLGCVQPLLRPATDSALEKVLAHFGVTVQRVSGAGCCGALSYHTGAEQAALHQARANIDQWWPLIEAGGVVAIVSTASGCAVHLKDYVTLLSDNAEYAHKARVVTDMMLDPAQLVSSLMEQKPECRLPALSSPSVSFHCPCTLQHGQQLDGLVEGIFEQLGVRLPSINDSHLCCGSAGTYSVLQPDMANKLRAEKMANLLESHPAQIITANIGCQLHLQAATRKPVRHWLELIAEQL